jgi:hypothetical protein
MVGMGINYSTIIKTIIPFHPRMKTKRKSVKRSKTTTMIMFESIEIEESDGTISVTIDKIHITEEGTVVVIVTHRIELIIKLYRSRDRCKRPIMSRRKHATNSRPRRA